MELQVLKELILEEFNERIEECGYDGEEVTLQHIGDYKEIHFREVSEHGGKWSDEGKYSHRSDVYRAIADGKETDVYIRVSKSRCGSYFTEYEYFNELGELVQLMEDVQVVKKWVAASESKSDQEKTMELQILAKSVPVIKFNKDGLKLALQEHLDKYSNLVVTTETEKDCKKAKAELGKLETAIETFRKDTKKALSEPIANFEADCKELVALIQEVKQPIDNQLKEIEEQRKAERVEQIREEIAKIVIEYELDEKHSAQIQINSTWLNKTTSMSKITTEIKNLAETLKIAQTSVVRYQEIIKATCEMHNGRLKTRLDATGWLALLDRGEDVQSIVEKIHAEGKRRLAAEIEKEEKQAQEILNTPEPKPIVHEEPIQKVGLSKEAQGPELCATLKFYGTAAQFKCLKDVMTKIGIRYEKVEL